MVGTVLGSQILHNGAEIRNLATRVDDARDDFHASVRAEIQALRSELAARVGPGHVDEMRRDHRRLHERMHNLEHELSEVDQSMRGLRSDIATTQSLNEHLQDIQKQLERFNQTQQNLNRPAAAPTNTLDERMRDIRDELRDVNRNLARPRSSASRP